MPKMLMLDSDKEEPKLLSVVMAVLAAAKSSHALKLKFSEKFTLGWFHVKETHLTFGRFKYPNSTK